MAETVLKNADNQPDVGSLAGLWSTLLLFVGATAVFAQLQNALNLIFRTSGERLEGLKAWLRKRVLVRRGAGPGLPADPVDDCHHGTAGRLRAIALDPPALGYVTSLLLYAVGFAFMYHYLPDRRVAWRQAFIGGVITSALFALGRYGIGVTSPPWPRQCLRLDGRAGDLAGLDLLRDRGLLRWRADDCGDR